MKTNAPKNKRLDNPKLPELLLRWYWKHARDLPWRHTKDPYKIWVSEIMLQQTQVSTVIPYYTRWVQQFPDVQTLATAAIDDVMHCWAGLGYYRRAKMLHEGASTVLKSFKGHLPAEAHQLIKIPGIGRYTAGAIASIAFGKKEPVLDGNVMRVLSRIFLIKKNIAQPATLQHLWTIATHLVPKKHPGDFNQALMELGATVCTPLSPACTRCPCRNLCKARQANLQAALPKRTKSPVLSRLITHALIIRCSDQVLIRKQTQGEMWAGLWVFPFWREKKAMLDFFSLQSVSCPVKASFRHNFTKYKATVRVYESVEKPAISNLSGKGFRWCKVSQLGRLGLPSPHQKISSFLFKD